MAKYNVSQFFKKNQLFILLMTVVLVLGTIAAIILSGKPTEKNTRAAGDSVGIILTPSSQTVQPNQQFTVTIQADAGSLALTGYDMTFQIDNNVASIVSFSPSNTFNSSLINTIKNPTTIRIAAVDTSTNQITGLVTLGVLTIQAKTPGAAGLLFLINPQITASGHDAAIPANCSPASFAIATPPTATSAPTNVPEAPTSTPTPTPTPSPTPIVESNNNQGDNSNSNSDNGSSNSDNHAFDFNGDGHINLPDLVVLIRNFHKSGQGDLNADGKVDITDFSILLRHWTN